MSDAAEQQQAPAPEDSPDDIAIHRGGLVLCLMLAVSLHTIDATIVNVSLPHMQGTLQATFDQITWIVTTYIMAAVVLTPLVGWAASRFGVKKLLTLAIILFTLSSVMCGLSMTLETMLAARLLQGASGAPLIPLAIATLNRLSSGPAERARLMAIFGLGIMAGPVLGPSLGGYITEISTWRWIFFINVPVGTLAVVGITLTMKAGKRIPGHKLNIFGFLSLAVAIACLQLVLDQGESEDWFESGEIIAYALTCVGAFWIFLINSMTSARPFLPGALFRDRNFLIGMTLILIAAGGMTASVVLQPPMMQQIMRYPVLNTGFLLIPRGVGMMAGMMLTPRLIHRFDPRILLGLGGALMVAGISPFIFLTADTPALALAIPPIFHGFGIGITFVMASTIAYATIPSELQVVASSVYSLVRGIGQSISISVVVAFVTRMTQINHAELAARITPFRSFIAPGSPFADPVLSTKKLALANMVVAREGAMIAYNDGYVLLACMAMAAFLTAFLVKPKVGGLGGKQDVPHDA
ncbi:DHA2 family efflux MFS transporter permease subunit [Kordiimonas marina]|uniref:DHA2 family efflux MFS transporter permease subunit n=1 Tax=Kordiimonas marina TaxID=2872312 RepID=UPI001FF4796D|nr:DHA2 family efflux MFS transporter permease subunit [Kordiimonas marina]MCJ9427893.1 DHA2 family efflux MFS transporter permease subunit [Kordiimonas marina]